MGTPYYILYIGRNIDAYLLFHGIQTRDTRPTTQHKALISDKTMAVDGKMRTFALY